MKQSERRERVLLEQKRAKYGGIGDADTDRTAFVSNLRRDTYASLVGNQHLTTHLTVAGVAGSRKEVKRNLLDKMVNSS